MCTITLNELMEYPLVYLLNLSRIRVASGRARKLCLRTRHASSDRNCLDTKSVSVSASVRACFNVCAYAPVQISYSVKMLAGYLVVLLAVSSLAIHYLTRPQQL